MQGVSKDKILISLSTFDKIYGYTSFKCFVGHSTADSTVTNMENIDRYSGEE